MSQHSAGKEPLTLVIHPHSPRHSITIRLSTWVQLTFFLVASAMGMMVALFLLRYHLLTQEVARLQEAQRAAAEQQQALQQTIVSQEALILALNKEVATLSTVQQDYDRLYQQVMAFEAQLAEQVAQFQGELQQIQQLSREVRLLVGMPEREGPAPQGTLQAVGGDGGGQSLSVRSAIHEFLNLEANPAVRQLQDGYQTLPMWYEEMRFLHSQVEERVALVDANHPAANRLKERQAIWQAAPRGSPVEGPTSSTFGYRLFRGQRDFHTGVDIAVAPRTPVHATAAGKVLAAGWQSGYGWTVELEHSHGYTTLYGHLSRYLVEVGDGIRKGQVIGLSGNSGNSTGPHLHYEIRLNGIAIDPWRYTTPSAESRE